MKRFIETKFFFLLKEASPSGIDTLLLATEYDAFASSLFAESALMQNKNNFYNLLCYTQVEFEILQSKKKYRGSTAIYQKGTFAY